MPQPIRKTAKLFKSGRSQAVRLPAEFRFPGTEVAIRRDPATGEVILSPAPAPQGSWQEFFERADRLGVPDDFMADRELEMSIDRDPFRWPRSLCSIPISSATSSAPTRRR